MSSLVELVSVGGATLLLKTVINKCVICAVLPQTGAIQHGTSCPVSECAFIQD